MRKKTQEFILNMIDKIDIGGENPNTKLYKDLFKSMSDAEFHDFMVKLRDNKLTLSMIIPNGGPVKVSVENNMNIAKSLGHSFLERIFVGEHNGINSYYTPIEYLVMLLPIRRAVQTLTKKISIPKGNSKIDVLTGQVTGDSQSAKLTLPETQMLLGMGLKISIKELLRDRGGDLGARIAMNNMLFKTGKITQAMTSQYSTGVVSVKTLSAYWKASHINNTL